ncbi:MAG: class I SAM-dependent methyltransferase [Thiomargarita sp.]|nr:class I SAM-dependent methyltransferase [Thiomargarita sp.]
MEPSLYPQMAALEKKHWWFSARRTIIEHLLKKLNLPAQAKIFEAGCGTGGNLSLLSQYGQVYAMELNDTAREFARQNTEAKIWAGSLPDEIPFEKEQFDLIVLFDVLEHLEKDSQALESLRTYLKPSGYLFITVPALPLLWSEHDERHHHYRRYLKKELRQLVKNAGFKVTLASYFNCLLFPMVLAARYLHRFSKKTHDDLTLPAPWLNGLLKTIFASERYLLNVMSLPIGVSLILLARKSL